MRKPIQIQTLSKQIRNINQLAIEVGTNAPCGGDSGAGGRTFLEIQDKGGTSWDFCVTTEDGEDHTFSNPNGLSITMGGDSELQTLIEALEFTLNVLKKQAVDGQTKTREIIF
jgi:hypothetical protein